MGVTVKSTNRIPQIVKVLKKLKKTKIQVGVFGEDGDVGDADINLAQLARVHEYGMTITPKRAQFLTIPLVKEAKGKRAGDFPDLFPVGLEDGNGVLARDDGRGGIEPIFALVKSVTIPERSFIRGGFDANENKIVQKAESLIDDVLQLRINPDTFADMLGLEFAGLIQKYARNLRSPGNAAVTKAVKGSSNPLVDTGRLIGSIRHKVD